MGWRLYSRMGARTFQGLDFRDVGDVMNLNRYNGKRIALVMDVQGREVVLRGTISLRIDTKQGHMLQVTIAEDDDAAVGCPVFLVSENRWKHQISSGIIHECEYLLDLSQTAVTAG